MEISQEHLKKIREQIIAEKIRQDELKKASEKTSEPSRIQESSMDKEIAALLARNQEEESSFAQLVPEVKALPVQDVVLLNTSRKLSEEQTRIRRQSATAEKKNISIFSMDHIRYLSPLDITGFYQDGIQKGVFRKVKNAEYSIRDYLDLHNHTLQQACTAVEGFIEKSYKLGLRFVIIIHGKGEYTKPPAFLKSYVYHWLQESPLVLAAHHALPYHGGPGSIYVLLKKNDIQKENNREDYSSR